MLSTICSAKQKSLQMCAELRHCQRWVTNGERQRVPQWRTRDGKTLHTLQASLCSVTLQDFSCGPLQDPLCNHQEEPFGYELYKLWRWVYIRNYGCKIFCYADHKPIPRMNYLTKHWNQKNHLSHGTESQYWNSFDENSSTHLRHFRAMWRCHFGCCRDLNMAPSHCLQPPT